MGIGNCANYYSRVMKRITEFMSDPQYIATEEGEYTTDMEDAIYNMFKLEFPEVEWRLIASQSSNHLGGSLSLAWIEDGHLYMTGWDYIAI